MLTHTNSRSGFMDCLCLDSKQFSHRLGMISFFIFYFKFGLNIPLWLKLVNVMMIGLFNLRSHSFMLFE